MINLTVINLKDFLKYLVGVIAFIIITFSITRYFFNDKISFNVSEQLSNLLNYSFTNCLEIVIPAMKNDIDTTNEKIKNSNLLKDMLSLELGMMDNCYLEEKQKIEIENLIEKIDINMDTEVIEDKNLVEKYTNTYSNVKIKNTSDYELTDDIFIIDQFVQNKKDIIIFHTHTCESYTPTEQYNYEMTGNYRTTDLNYTVARVGTELERYLSSSGYNVIHNVFYHDYPAYSGSYERSLETVSNILNDNPVELVFDLHRDSIGNGSEYAPTVKIGDEIAAQLMFVIGTSAGGLEHPNWKDNLKIAIQIQQKAEELYPGLFRPIMVSNSRYNQHLAKGASIIEVGATGNTLEQTLISMKYLAKIIDAI